MYLVIAPKSTPKRHIECEAYRDVATMKQGLDTPIFKGAGIFLRFTTKITRPNGSILTEYNLYQLSQYSI